MKRKIGISLIIIFALLANIRLFKKSRLYDLKDLGNDQVTLYEKRFDGVKRYLGSVNIVGFITDIDDKRPPTDIEFARRYFLTQYALSPIIVLKDYNHDIIIANFHNYDSELPDSIKEEFTLLKDFGKGLKIFKRES